MKRTLLDGKGFSLAPPKMEVLDLDLKLFLKRSLSTPLIFKALQSEVVQP